MLHWSSFPQSGILVLEVLLRNRISKRIALKFSRIARFSCPLFFVLLSLFLPSIASAHGGAVQMQKKAGPFQITVFSQPGVISAGPVDLSVLVQRDQQSNPILDADVVVGLFPVDEKTDSKAWQPPYCAMDNSQSLNKMTSQRAAAGNQLVYEVLAKIPSPGQWLLRVQVKEEGNIGVAETQITVGDPPTPWTTYWPLFAFPVLAITGFCILSASRSSR
jgi:hypothetical protein